MCYFPFFGHGFVRVFAAVGVVTAGGDGGGEGEKEHGNSEELHGGNLSRRMWLE